MRSLVIHGHFYQPPRLDPWYEEVPRQPSAAPEHDWNARVCQECYAPNAAARLLDDHGRVRDFVDNYAHISFDFGPTLMEWLERHDEETYAAVIAADHDSRRRLGHGNALAQAHGHLIMPLAGERDRRTQVIWGIADFAHRFGRDPEGMWLPETAVDLPTLEALCDHGIRFTILAPSQAARFRDPGQAWQPVKGEIDGRAPYRVQLPSGRSLVLFFYDGYLSRGIAFEGLLQSGERLVSALAGAFDSTGRQQQLVHVATDGETYGHHHRFGEMALAYAIDALRTRQDVRLTNYAAYLAGEPEILDVELRERTSWSCVHGVERWRADCGCHTGGSAGWNQKWRAPLRQALDELGDALAQAFEGAAGALLRDPWAARDQYVELLLQDGEADRRAWVSRQAIAGIDARGIGRALMWLESQRQAMAMFTSCGWFFNDVAGIETEQVLLHAARAMQLARDAGGPDLEPAFVTALQSARSNRAAVGTAADLWAARIVPRIAARSRVAASAALLVLLGKSPRELGAYRLEVQPHAAPGGEEVRAAVIVRDLRDLSSDELLVHGRFEGDELLAIAQAAGGSERAYRTADLTGADGSRVRDALLAHEEEHVLAAQRRLLRRFGPAVEGLPVELETAFRAVVEADLRSLLASGSDGAGVGDLHSQLLRGAGGRGVGRLEARTMAVLRQALARASGSAASDRHAWLEGMLQLARLRRDLAPEVDAWRAQRRVHAELPSAAAEPQRQSWVELAELLDVRLPDTWR